MTDELADLKRKNWTLTQELENYKQEHVRLSQRVQEWFEWSQGIQLTLKEKDEQINNLMNQITALENEKNALVNRLSTADMAMTENLYEQNSRLEMIVKENQIRVKTLEDVIFNILTGKIDQKTSAVYRLLKESSQGEYRVFAFLSDAGKPVRESEIYNNVRLPREDVKRALNRLLREKVIDEYTSGVYTVIARDSGYSSVTSGSGPQQEITASSSGQDIFSTVSSKLQFSSSSSNSLSLLSELKDQLTSEGYSNLAFEVLQVMRELQSGTITTQTLQLKLNDWKKQYISSKEVVAEEVKIDLMPLNTLEILNTVREQIKSSKDIKTVATILDRMKDVLMQKSVASGPLLYDMNKTVNEAKKGNITAGFVLSKLDDWQDKIS
ncbi:MAG: hypothetical protein ACTSRU_15325 [Candidatus Hodarchaeales archaeon]